MVNKHVRFASTYLLFYYVTASQNISKLTLLLSQVPSLASLSQALHSNDRLASVAQTLQSIQ